MLNKTINLYSLDFKKRDRIILFLEAGLLVCSVALMLSWPLHHTIALRNISLAMGCFLGVIWLIYCHPKFQLKNYWTVLLISCIPIWLLIHLFFFPVSYAHQWDELDSLWLRVGLSIPFAFSLGLMLAKRAIYPRVLVLVCIVYPFIMFIMWLAEIVAGDSWKPLPSYVFKTKVAGTYFLMWSFLLGCAMLHKLSCRVSEGKSKGQLVKISIVFLPIILVVLSIFGMILLDSLNGILVCMLVGLTLILFCLMNFFFGVGTNRFFQVIIFTIVSIILIGAGSFYVKNSPAYQVKLVPIVFDIEKSFNLENNRTWQRTPDTQNLPDPINEMGMTVNGSTYERISWFIEGLNSLVDRPLGVGYVSQSFGHHMSNKYFGSAVDKTHCGWLDLAIGLGIPGILLLWLAVAGIVLANYRGLKLQNSSIQLSAVWMLCGMFVLWWPAELAEREFIESLLFVITLFSGTSICIFPSKDHKNKGIPPIDFDCLEKDYQKNVVLKHFSMKTPSFML